MIHAGRNIKGARVNVLGLTFKEDVPDIRNSKVVDILARAARVRRRGARARPAGERRGRAARVRRQAALVGRAAGGRRADPRGVAQALPRDAGAGIPEEDRARRLRRSTSSRCSTRRRSAAKGCGFGGCSESCEPASCAGPPSARRASCASACSPTRACSRAGWPRRSPTSRAPTAPRSSPSALALPTTAGEPWLARAYTGLDQWAFGADGCEPVDLLHELPDGRLLDAAVPRPARARPRRRVRARRASTRRRSTAWRASACGASRSTARREVAAGEAAHRLGADGAPRARRGAAPRLPVVGAHLSALGVAQPRRAAAARPRSSRCARCARRSAPAASGSSSVRCCSRRHATATSISRASRSVGRILRRGVEKALAIEQWSLAFSLRAAQTRTPSSSGFTRIVPPADRDWSEPFALEKNGRYYVFFKEVVRGSGKAHIAMLELGADGRWSAPVRVLERDYHLSHPFVVEHDGQLYLIPESARNRTRRGLPLRRLPAALAPGARAARRRAPGRRHVPPVRRALVAVRQRRRRRAAASTTSSTCSTPAACSTSGSRTCATRCARTRAAPARPARSTGATGRSTARRRSACRATAPGIALNRVLRLTPQAYAERAGRAHRAAAGQRPARPAHREPRRRPDGGRRARPATANLSRSA